MSDLGAVLGQSRVVWGQSCAVLQRSWGCLGRSWGILWCHDGPLEALTSEMLIFIGFTRVRDSLDGKSRGILDGSGSGFGGAGGTTGGNWTSYQLQLTGSLAVQLPATGCRYYLEKLGPED